MIDLNQVGYYHTTTFTYMINNNFAFNIEKISMNKYAVEPFVVDNYTVVVVASTHIDNYIEMNKKTDFAFVENYRAPLIFISQIIIVSPHLSKKYRKSYFVVDQHTRDGAQPNRSILNKTINGPLLLNEATNGPIKKFKKI